MEPSHEAFLQHARALRREMDEAAPQAQCQRTLKLLDPHLPALAAALAEQEAFDFNFDGDREEQDFRRLRRALNRWTEYAEDEEFALSLTDAPGLTAELRRLLERASAGKDVDWIQLRALAAVLLAGAQWQHAEWHAGGDGETDARYKAFLALVSVLLTNDGQEPMPDLVEWFFERPHPVDVLGYLAWQESCSRRGSHAVTFERVESFEAEGIYPELAGRMSDLWRSGEGA